METEEELGGLSADSLVMASVLRGESRNFWLEPKFGGLLIYEPRRQRPGDAPFARCLTAHGSPLSLIVRLIQQPLGELRYDSWQIALRFSVNCAMGV